MKQFIHLLIPAMILASCGDQKSGNKAEELAKLKKERAELDIKIKSLEAGTTTVVKATPVSILEVHPTVFNGVVEIQSQISGDANVMAMPQSPGIVQNILVQPGQRVGKGQVLVTLDAGPLDRQIEALSPQIALAKSMYEKTQALWKENIGTEIQLLKAKTDYEVALKQLATLKSQRDLSRIISPITGVVDAVSLKVGDMAAPGNPQAGIRVVSYDKLKAEANLGENYLGKVKTGDAVTLLFPDLNDSMKTKLTYVGTSVEPMSRSFRVEVRLASNVKLHPNMSCIMKIANYTNNKAIVVPIQVIQKTSTGNMVYLADGNKARLAPVAIGRISNGLVEVTQGLNDGDKVVVAGYQDLDDGEAIAIQ